MPLAAINAQPISAHKINPAHAGFILTPDTMEIELIEIRDFLARHPPFEVLPDAVLDHLPGNLSIRYLRRGGAFPPPTSDDRQYLYIIRSGAIEFRGSDGNLCEKLGEGDFYSSDCRLMDIPEDWHALGSEDTLLYLLDCEKLQQLRQNNEDFSRHFSRSLNERLKHAVSTINRAYMQDVSVMGTKVMNIVKRAPVTIAAGSNIKQAAQAMTENKISSIMIMEGDKLVGLLTDSTLRKRCIVEGVPADAPVTSIVKPKVTTIDRHASLFEALMIMTQLQVYHLPVMDGDKLVGIVTSSDLARHQSINAAFLASDIRKAATLDDLVRTSRTLPELQLQLSNASASAFHVGDAVSSITDAITCKLLALAEVELGAPPVPYAWVAGGSQARHEQTSHSDQDNALILADSVAPAHETYFSTLAKRVSDGLSACGYSYCPGNAMATNGQWRQPLRKWRQYFHAWIDQPEPKALMLACIFFDLRTIYGDASLLDGLKQEVLRKTRGNRIFIAYMAANALSRRPPLGFFRNFVLIHDGKHNDTFDIKHRGIIPITDLARVFALSDGLTAVGTVDRLRNAARSGAVSKEMGENLVDAFEYIATIRLQHQAQQIRQGRTIDNYVSPGELSELERTHLKDAFAVIKDMQEALDNRYQLARFR